MVKKEKYTHHFITGVCERDIIREQIVNRWGDLGFLGGQVRTLINENTHPENGFDTIHFPTIRQVTPRLISQDIIPEQPILDLQYLTPNLEQEVESYLDNITWRSDETWSYENLYGSKIGVKMELKPLDFIKKYRSVFDTNNTVEFIYGGVPEPDNRHENINPLINWEFDTN